MVVIDRIVNIDVVCIDVDSMDVVIIYKVYNDVVSIDVVSIDVVNIEVVSIDVVCINAVYIDIVYIDVVCVDIPEEADDCLHHLLGALLLPPPLRGRGLLLLPGLLQARHREVLLLCGGDWGL